MLRLLLQIALSGKFTLLHEVKFTSLVAPVAHFGRDQNLHKLLQGEAQGLKRRRKRYCTLGVELALRQSRPCQPAVPHIAERRWRATVRWNLVTQSFCRSVRQLTLLTTHGTLVIAQMSKSAMARVV